MKQVFPTIKPTLYDPTQSDYSTNPFTSAGTFKTFQGIDLQGNPSSVHEMGPGSFIPNALGQKALDAIKTDTGISITPQWDVPFAPGVQGYYDAKSPGNTANVRTVNFTSDSPNINVLLHESGHAVDPKQGTAAYGPSFNPTDYKQQLTPSDQLNYLWQHAGFPNVQAETEAQRFARGYAYQLSPALGHAMTADPWFEGYPKSYGDETIQSVFESQLPSPKRASFTSPVSPNIFDASSKIDTYGVENTDTRWGSDPRKALGMALDPRFQQTQRDILQQANDYVNNTLR
jgi:hypothetical protein